MKLLLIIFYVPLMALIIISDSSAQQTIGFNLALHVCVPDESVKPFPSAKSLMESKLLEMISSTGMSGYKGGRFFISPKIAVLNQQVLDGPPAKVVIDVAVTFFIADNTDQKVVNSYYKELKGVGASADQAMMNAIRNLNGRDKEVTSFVQEARSRIVQFYSQNCEAIIAGAQSKSIDNIARAMENLSMIPMENAECYKEAQIELQMLYGNYVHRRCADALTKARAIWSSAYTIESASRAINSLEGFFIDEQCQENLNALSDEMRARVEKNEEFEREFAKLLLESENKKMELNAEILKEIIRSQPQEVYNTEFIFVD
jgi:hypothetical protein